MWKIIQITFFIYLVILSVLDIRTRKLPMWLLAAGGICVILSQLIRRETPWELCLFGAAAGCIFLMISKMTRKFWIRRQFIDLAVRCGRWILESDQFAGNRIFSVSSGFCCGIGIWKIS